jgi:hypothetical protein
MVRVALAILLSMSACAEISGLDGLGVCDGACADVTVDVQQSPDSSVDVTPNGPDGGGGDVTVPKDVSTIEASPPMDASGPCIQPSDCNKTGEVCCETLVTKGNGFPQCTVDADTIGCTSEQQCQTQAGFTCGTFVVRRCTANTDCTESNVTKCCTVKLSGDAGSRQICMSSINASAAGATCL